MKEIYRISLIIFQYLILKVALLSQLTSLPELVVGPTSGVRPHSQIIAYNDKLFFYGNSESTGFEPCLLNLKTNEYKIIKDINQGIESSEGFYFNQINNFIIFPARDNKGDYELYKFDFALENLEQLININKSESGIVDNYSSASTGKEIFFTAKDERFGEELWITDGTVNGTRIVKDIESGSNGSFPVIYGYNSKLKKVIFSAYNSQTGEEFYVSDGTPQGTVLLLDVYNGSGSGAIQAAVVTENFMYFVGDSPSSGTHIYKTDGTPAGTKQATTSNIQYRRPYSLIPYDDKCIFFCNNTNMYITDGSPSGNIRLAEILVPHEPGLINSQYLSWVNYNKEIFLAADQTGTGENIELFKTNGTIAGTKLVKEIFNSGSSNISGLTRFNNKIFFAAYGAHKEHEELWMSDGSDLGTKLVSDINPGNESSYPGGFLAIDSCLFFTAEIIFKGFELFKYCEPITNIKETKNSNLKIYYQDKKIYYSKNINLDNFSIYNLEGLKIEAYRKEIGIIELSDKYLKNGVYFLIANDKNNGIKYSSKILICEDE